MPHSIETLPRWLRIPRSIVVLGAASCLLACGGGGSGGPSGSSDDPGTGEAQPDTTAPSPPTSVSSTAAASSITVSWSGAVDNVGVTSYKVYRDGNTIATIASTSHTETGLGANTRYCYDITATDAAGNESAHSAQTCATPSASADTTAPTITTTRPANDATGVAIDTVITVEFDEAMDPATLNQTTFKVGDAHDNAVSGTVNASGTTATFTPTDILAASESYTATIAADVRDLAGNALATPYSAAFKTGLALYELTAIGDDPAGDDELFTLVNDLNEQGEVAGEAITNSSTGQTSGAFLWRDGRLIDLGALSTSVRDSRSQGLNDASDVIGWSYADAGELPAFLWRENAMTPLSLEDAYAVNNEGQVVGYVTRIQGGEAVSVAVVWRAGQLTELSGVANPWNINNAGDVVGFSSATQGDQASLWRAGVVTLLGLLPGAMSSQAFDINNEGLIIGTSQFAPPTSATTYERAFLWQSGGMTELPRISTNHTSSDAYGINDRGDIVGRSGTSQYNATLWLDGAAYDLNELIVSDDPLKQHVTLLEAREINNRGQIIAQGTDARRSGSYTGYLLTPKRAR